MLASSPFKQSRLSWFRCPHCGATTYKATTRALLSKARPVVTLEYKCHSCEKLSTLRNPRLVNVALPIAVATCAFFLVYRVLSTAASWHEPTAIATVLAIVCLEVVVSLVISRITKRFDKVEF